MDASPFAAILADTIARIPGAFAAALVDADGETVDYAGDVDPFDAKVAAAHWRIVMMQLEGCALTAGARTLRVRTSRASVIVASLPEAYALVVLMGRRSGFGSHERALSHAQQQLAREAGWTLAPGRHWLGVEVVCDARRRPVLLRHGDHEDHVEVLGRMVGLPRRERGYRLRRASGPEITLVREPGDRWYVEGP